MSISMVKVDTWLIHGLGGLVNICSQRAELLIGIQSATVEKFLEEVERLNEVTKKICRKGHTDGPGDLGQMDSWMWRGINGLVNMLEARVEQIAEPMKMATVRVLEREVGRLRILVEKLSGFSSGTQDVCSG